MAVPGTAPAAAVSRVDRRKARTRSALIQAAQGLLAAGRTDVSIQEITERADVGFGSFYNHFASKAELFHEAVLAALDTHVALLDTLTAHLRDPAEVFALSFRLTGRLQRVQPQLTRVMLSTGTSLLLADTGMPAQARRHIRAAAEQGRFDIADADVALAWVGGALLGLLQLLDARPELDAAALTDATAERVLLMLGLKRRDAVALASRPLPALPRG